jgi:hypothetical protein
MSGYDAPVTSLLFPGSVEGAFNPTYGDFHNKRLIIEEILSVLTALANIFQIRFSHMNQTMPQHIDRRLSLFQHNIAN